MDMYGEYPPGHFYSTIPNLDDVIKRQDKIFQVKPHPEIPMNDEEQHELLLHFEKYYSAIPFPIEKPKQYDNKSTRYYFDNDSFGANDGISLYSMIRKNKPKKIIEVGSGFSSMVMLDTNELFFDNNIDIITIDPYPQRFHSLLKSDDMPTLYPRIVQDVDYRLFTLLDENDILFIDSSHVSKVGSDVNYLILEILPKLNKGVIVHFHDIQHGFEYHKEFIIGRGWYWNEQYILKAFLAFNDTFKIEFFNNYMGNKYDSFYKSKMPLCASNIGGSLYLRKVK